MDFMKALMFWRDFESPSLFTTYLLFYIIDMKIPSVFLVFLWKPQYFIWILMKIPDVLIHFLQNPKIFYIAL